MKCPNCGSDHITHSYRRGVEKMYRYIYPRTPYRCKECWSRFWVFENPFQTLTAKVAAGASAAVLLVLLIWPLTAGDEDKPGLKPGPEAVVIGTAERRTAEPSVKVDKGSTLTRQEVPLENEDRNGSSYPAKRPEISGGEGDRRSAERTRPRVHEETPRAAFESTADGGPKTVAERIGSAEETPGIGTESPGAEKEEFPPPEAETTSAVTKAEKSGAFETPPAATAPSDTSPALSEAEPPGTDREAISTIPVITSTETLPPETDTIEESSLKIASAERENRQKTPEATATEPKIFVTEPALSTEPEPQSAQPQPKAESKPEIKEAPPENAIEETQGPEEISTPADEPKPVKRAVKTARKPASQPRRLSEIVPKPAGDRFEALIKAGGGITDYRSFFLKSPPKLVIDLPGKWEQKTRSVIEVDHALVKRVRVGEHPEFIRVVLDLEKEIVSKPDFTETAEGLRVSLTRDSQ